MKKAYQTTNEVYGEDDKLTEAEDSLSLEVLERVRRTAWAGRKIYYFPVVDSTNDKARQLAAEGCPDGTLVVAGRQEAGKGRRGRSWVSPDGCGIFMTLLLKPDICPDNASMLTLVAALSVVRAIENQTKVPVGIKWPNDIVLNGKKICGILTEMCMDSGRISHVVVGIGINVHNASFPNEVSETATSLYLETGMHCSRAALIEEVLEQFETFYAIYRKTEELSGLVGVYDAHLVNRHRQVRVLDPTEPFEGEAQGITPRGELIVDTPDGRRLVSAGEVSVRGVYGYV